MVSDFWVITSFFNPAKYESLLNNYFCFAESLRRQKVNLMTVECAFGDDAHQIPLTENVVRLRAESVMWQKERLINHGVSLLPSSCKYYAWIDCDIIFKNNNNWVELAKEKLQNAQMVQLFKKIYHLPKGVIDYVPGDDVVTTIQGVIWQQKIHKNWLERRKTKDLSFSAPGFAWACHKNTFDHVGGVYDKNIVGSGDTFIVDCLLDSWEIHGFSRKFTPPMKEHMYSWYRDLRKVPITVDYLPIDIFHLWHGNLKKRQYMDRHDAIIKGNYDPSVDIRLVNNVYEWASDKPEMHKEIRNYFFSRKEDDEE